MAVYIPIGHGYENLTHPRDIVPEGCSVTVIETPGGAHMWNPEASGEIYEYERIKGYFERNPPEKNAATGKIHSIFSDPKHNVKDIIDTFGSAGIFGPGEKYPNIEYSLNLYWINNVFASASDVRYSGLIPLENFLSKEYTTSNIREKLLTNKSTPVTATGAGAAYFPYGNNKAALLHNKKEQYKFSIFPSVANIEQFWSSDEQKVQALEEKGFHDLAEKLRTDYATGESGGDAEEKSIELFEGVSGPPLKQEGFIYVSLKTLMEKFPGNYIHIVCRSTEETGPQLSTNPSAEQEHTQEEVFTKRIPLMSGNQKKQAIANIEQSRKNRVKSRFNKFSTKNTRNIMLAGLKRSLVQNQIKNTGNPIVLKAPVERPNTTVKANGSKKNKVEYTGRKWATVTTGGRTRRKLYKSKSCRNSR